MKKFVFKTIVFGAFLFFVLIAIKLSVPYYWGNELIGQKIDYISQQNSNYDVIFIGSSKTYRHINPIQFDKITNSNSYNLGSFSMFNLESNYILENYLSKNHKFVGSQKLDVFQQGLVPGRIAKKNLHSVRSKYFLDFKRLKKGVSFFWKRSEYQQVYYHLLSYIENSLCIGELRAIIDYHVHGQGELNDITKKQKGFYSLNQELEFENTTELIKRSNIYRKSIKNISKKKLPKIPKLRMEAISSKKASIQIPSSNLIRFFQISNFKLDSPYMFDRSHLNSKGVEIYTNEIALKYQDLRKKSSKRSQKAKDSSNKN